MNTNIARPPAEEGIASGRARCLITETSDHHGSFSVVGIRSHGELDFRGRVQSARLPDCFAAEGRHRLTMGGQSGGSFRDRKPNHALQATPVGAGLVVLSHRPGVPELGRQAALRASRSQTHMKRDDCNDTPPSDFEIARLFADDEQLSVVLRAHLYVEHFLTLLLSKALAHAGRRDIFDMTFSQKVELALAHSVIPSDERAAFRAINAIRNRFAHEPRAWLFDDDADALWRTFSPRMRERLAVTGRCGPQDFDLAVDFFKCAVIAICYILEEQLRDAAKRECKV